MDALAPSTTTVTHATSSADSDANGTRRSNIGVTTTTSASASSTINSVVTTNATDVIHHGPLLHARARNCSAPTTFVLSPLDCDKPTGQVTSTLRASRRMTETEIQKHVFGST